METEGFFNLKSSYISYLPLSDSFEYLYYVSTAISNILIISASGPSTYKGGPRAERVNFSPTWSCVSLTRSTSSSEWKLVKVDQMEVNEFEIFLINLLSRFIFRMLESWYLMC